MEKPQFTVAERLREALRIRGKTQADLMREADIDRGAISRYVSGAYEPKQKAIYKMAQALSVNESWLLGYDVPMDRTPMQKKNDQLAELVVELRTDDDLYNTVVALAELKRKNEKQYRGIKQILDAFQE